MTERIERLKQKLEAISDSLVFYERAALLMEKEKEYRNEPNGRRYALSFRHLLRHMTVQIGDGELLVGMAKEILLSPQQEKQFSVWCQRHNQKATDLFSFDPLGILEITDSEERFAPDWLSSYGHLIPDWGKVLSSGYGGLRAEALRRMDDSALTGKQREFLENAVIACEAMSAFIRRYAELAQMLADTADDAAERARLLTIVRVCGNIAEGAAGDFREAIQLVWFTMLVIHVVCGARDYAYGRFDQYMYPYYKADMDGGRLTSEQALELIECLFIKSNEIIGYGWEAYKPKRILTVNSLQYILLSGADTNGADTTNDISWLVLDAIDELKCKQPTVNVRYHKNIDKAFFARACQITVSGLGYPSYFNDGVVIEALVNNGVDQEIAHDYGYYGCNNSFLPGHEDELREAWHCGPKYLEYALNRGACMLTGKVQGAVTPSPYKLKSMDDVWEALRLQIADGIKKTVAHVEQSDAYWIEQKPFSFESVLMTDCLQRASSMNDQGSLQKHVNNHFVGFATVANSLYAIQKFVFEDQRYTLTDFVELLKDNWADDEYTRVYAKERLPKFGNDDDAVDAIGQKLAQMYAEELLKIGQTRGGRKLYPSIYSLWHHRGFGKLCAATADGRLAGEEVSESQSPVYSTEQNGPTAMFNSVAKMPFSMTPSGGLNIKFQPSLFTGEQGYQYLVALLEGFFAKGGMHAQINVVGKETLVDAQQHPEQYKNLLVRVVGYSAYFVSLSPEQQQEIIERTELTV
jgi:formate C-acetyltransferase